MTIRTKASLIILFLLCSLAYLPAPVSASGNSFTISEAATTSSTDANENGQPVTLRELIIKGLVRLSIVPQPSGNPIFVSAAEDYLTKFQTASHYGSTGLLAHNYLAGQYFFQILPGQELWLVYSDGSATKFIVTEIQRYQALVPDSPFSDFIDLATGEHLTARQLFGKTYGDRPGRLILQTCIEAEQNPGWGRIFVIAVPASEME